MEWSVPRPSPTPRHWYPYYEAEEEEGQEQPPYATVLQTDRFADVNEMMTQGTDSSLKPDAASAFGSDGDGGVLLRPRSSSGMPQLEESTEFQPFTSGKKAAYADSSTLPPTLPMLSSPPQQLLEQQVPTQFSAQFSEFPPGIPSLYRPSMPSPSASIMPQVAARSADYFSEGIPTFYNVHSSVPTLPSSFGAVQQRPVQLAPGEGAGDSDDAMPHELPSNMSYPSPSTPTDTTVLPRFPVGNFPVGNYPGEVASSCTPPPVSLLGRAPRDSGLTEPFTRMATAREPKFSPDRRKLCCVEGCTSQARAFNRCKRHGGSKRCSSPGCTKSVQSRGLCIRHGGGSRCTEIGCTRASQSHGRCKMHGGGRPCIVSGCEKKAHLKRLCRRHGGGAKCVVTGCDKWAQRLGMCMTHAKGGALESSGMDHVDESPGFDRDTTPPPSTADSTPPPLLEMFTHEL